MATTIKQAFDEYASNLNITDRQTSLVSTARSTAVKALAQNLTLHPEESKLIGSYDRSTLTRYLSEGDVDVMVILNYGAHKDWDSSTGTSQVLDKFKSILSKTYTNTEIRRDRNCVTLKFKEFRLDLVPSFKNDGGHYKIPDCVRQLWLPTNPAEFADLITKVNKSMDGTFVPIIKMIKGWNREVDWPIRSFHLECLLYNHYRNYTQSYTYSSTINRFFENLPSYLRSSCYDPVMGDRVDGYLDNGGLVSRRDVAIGKANVAAQKAKEAFDDQENYPTIAIGEWKALLGEFFPAYG